MIKHIAANITAIATILGFCGLLFEPHIDKYFEARFHAALTSVKTTTHLQELDREEANRVIYWVSGRMLRVFLNIPKDQRTDFHKAEIILLESELESHREGPLSLDFNSGHNTPTN